MRVFLCILTGFMAISLLIEEKGRHNALALCFCVSMAALTIYELLQ